jgi:hypothetical protein
MIKTMGDSDEAGSHVILPFKIPQKIFSESIMRQQV